MKDPGERRLRWGHVTLAATALLGALGLSAWSKARAVCDHYDLLRKDGSTVGEVLLTPYGLFVRSSADESWTDDRRMEFHSEVIIYTQPGMGPIAYGVTPGFRETFVIPPPNDGLAPWRSWQRLSLKSTEVPTHSYEFPFRLRRRLSSPYGWFGNKPSDPTQ